MFEDKRDQTIASFEEHGESTPQRKDALPTLPSTVYTNLPQYSNAAPYVVLLDGLNTRNLDLAYARTQLLKFSNTSESGHEPQTGVETIQGARMALNVFYTRTLKQTWFDEEVIKLKDRRALARALLAKEGH